MEDEEDESAWRWESGLELETAAANNCLVPTLPPVPVLLQLVLLVVDVELMVGGGIMDIGFELMGGFTRLLLVVVRLLDELVVLMVGAG